MSDIITMAHDKDHPFSMVSNSLIRNSNISRDARMILILCLSYKSLKNWTISVPCLMRQEGMSKNKMYKIIDELIALGYMKRTSFLENGMKRYRYQVSEESIFKKSLPCPQKQDTEKEDSKKEPYLRKPFIPLKGTILSSKEFNMKCLEYFIKWLDAYSDKGEQWLTPSKGKTRYTLRCGSTYWKIYPRSDTLETILKKIDDWNRQIAPIYLKVNKVHMLRFRPKFEAFLENMTQNTLEEK